MCEIRWARYIVDKPFEVTSLGTFYHFYCHYIFVLLILSALMMKTPECWRTSRNPCFKVPSPQSPFAMMDRHTQMSSWCHCVMSHASQYTDFCIGMLNSSAERVLTNGHIESRQNRLCYLSAAMGVMSGNLTLPTREQKLLECSALSYWICAMTPVFSFSFFRVFFFWSFRGGN